MRLQWDSAAEITFALEDYLTLHGFRRDPWNY